MKQTIFKIYKPAVLCVLLLLKSMLVFAQSPIQQFWSFNQTVSGTFVWDNIGWNSQINNGPGTFTLAAPVWTTNNGKTNTKWLSCNDVVFGGNTGVDAAGIVNLSDILSNVKSIAFHPPASGNFTLSGGSITSCSANLPVTVDTGLNPAISSIFSGTNSITKAGAGTLTLTGANTYSGNMVIREGTVIANSNSSLGATSNILTFGDASSSVGAAASLNIGPNISTAIELTSINTTNFANPKITVNGGSSLAQNAAGLNCILNLNGNQPLTIAATNTDGHIGLFQDMTVTIMGNGIPAGTTGLILDGNSAGLRLTFGGAATTTPNNFTGDVIMKGTVQTQNTINLGATAVHQNLGFLNNSITVQAGGTWKVEQGTDTCQGLNGAGIVTLGSANGAMNNIGLTVGNNNINGSFSGIIDGTYGFAKTGTGTQILSGDNTYGGTTLVSAGTLQIGVGTAAGGIGSGPVNVSSGATIKWNKGSSNFTLNNDLSGTGTIWFQGINSSGARSQSAIMLRGNNSGFSGILKINKAVISYTELQSQLGSALISIEQGGTLQLLTNTTFNNTITLEDKCGWYYNDATANVLGGLRLQTGASISGPLILNNTTNVGLGDSSGLYSAIGMWEGGNSNINGVISGPGHLSMSCNTSGWNSPKPPPPPSNISLTGNGISMSNTYSGITVVSGQKALASLLLRKTGGAVAIPANGIVWMGNKTSGQSNLRMGDDADTGNTTGTARNQWDNQFGPNVLMQFNNLGVNNVRFDLQGTNQALAGLNSGTTSTVMAAIVQNQGISGFNPANPATLTLNGSSNYVYNGIMRDKDSPSVNPAHPNQLNLIWNGSGTQTLVGPNIKHTGTTNVNSGRLVCYNTSAYNSNTTINSGGIFEMYVPTLGTTITGTYEISGSGSLVKTGQGTQVLSGNNTYSGGITINEGTLTAGNINAFGTGTITVKSGATLDRNYFAINNNVIVEPGGIVVN